MAARDIRRRRRRLGSGSSLTTSAVSRQSSLPFRLLEDDSQRIPERARQRLGALNKQGNPLLGFLWGEAALHAVPRDLELQRSYRRKFAQKRLGKARVDAARKLGIRLWIMLRDQIGYEEFCRRSPRRPT